MFSMSSILDYKVTSPVNCDVPNRLYGGRSNTISNIKPNGLVCSDDDQRSMGSKLRIFLSRSSMNIINSPIKKYLDSS